jgi:DNA-binding FadR family transcriptional regulator
MTERLLYRRAQVSLRNYIRDNGLVAGDRLPAESAIAEELKVSRLSVREATRSMQALGIIEARPGSGLYVSAFSFRPLLDQLPYGKAEPGTALTEILTVREAMELGLMPAVAQLRGSAALTRCVHLAGEMAELERLGEPVDDLDREFHLRLYRALDNPLVEMLIELFWDVFTGLRSDLPGPEENTRGETHLRIVRALQEGETLASIHAMRAHFDDLRRRVETLRATVDEGAA